jgi:hypothetical protein
MIVSLIGFSVFAGMTGAAWMIEKKRQEKNSA